MVGRRRGAALRRPDDANRGARSRLGCGLLLLAAAAVGCDGGSSLALPGVPARGAPAADDAIYGYTDDHGRLVHVQGLEDVPPRLRPYARRVDREEEGSLSDLLDGVLEPSAPVVYRYTTADGRVKFTNLAATVPEAQRAAAKLDLSHVSLNSEVGRDLKHRLDAEHERLAATPHCQQLRAAASKSLLRATWDDHGVLVVTGGAIGLLLLVTPFMWRRFGGREWARALSMGISVLAVAGTVGYATVRSNRAVSALKAKAAPCQSETWSALARADDGFVQQVQLLQHLRIQQQGFEKIAQEGR